MFKGLRTKIESEKGRETQSSHPARYSTSNNDIKQRNSQPSGTNSESTGVANQTPVEDNVPETKKNSSLPLKPVQQQTNESRAWPSGDAGISAGSTNAQTIDQLREQVASLTQQLENTNRERDIDNEQNAQLYQLIERLRRNLESEKETNSNLQSKLEQSELLLKEKIDFIDSLEDAASNNSLFTPKDKFNPHAPVTMKDLQLKATQLQTQLSDKNRQLKVCHQTVNDIRKALQQEVLEHNKTKEMCNKLQMDLKQSKQDQVDTTVANNGSSLQSDIDVNHRRNSLMPVITTNEMDETNKQQYSVVNLDKDEKGLQVDKVSIQSKSSASVYDFDSNDLSVGINNKDVNHEYLRNVLFRYMTSSDKETTQHLVKAISVMMNFTAEQSEAVKSAMNSRLSWLRLK